MLSMPPISLDDPLFDQLAAALLEASDLEGLVRPLLNLLQTITGLESTYFTTIDPARQTQTVLYAQNTDRLSVPEGAQADWQDTLCKRALEQDRHVNNDVACPRRSQFDPPCRSQLDPGMGAGVVAAGCG